MEVLQRSPSIPHSPAEKLRSAVPKRFLGLRPRRQHDPQAETNIKLWGMFLSTSNHLYTWMFAICHSVLHGKVHFLVKDVYCNGARTCVPRDKEAIMKQKINNCANYVVNRNNRQYVFLLTPCRCQSDDGAFPLSFP